MHSLRQLLASSAVVLTCIFFTLFEYQLLNRSAVLALVFPILVLVALVMVRWPDTGTTVVIFAIYANLAVVAAKWHSVSQPASQHGLESGSRLVVYGVICVALAVPFTYHLIFAHEELKVNRTLALMLVLLIALVAASIFARDKQQAGRQLISFCTEGLVLYLLVINVIRTKAMLRRAIWAVLLAGAFMGGISLFQEVTHTQREDYGGLAQQGGLFDVDVHGNLAPETRTRAAGPIGEQNRYAQVLLVLLPFSVYFFRREQSRGLRWIALGCGTLTLAGVVLTFSRSAFVAIAVMGMLMFFMGWAKKYQLALVLLACLAVAVIEPDYVIRIRSLQSVTNLLTGNRAAPTEHSSALRYAENLAAFHVWADHPVLGVGPGQFPEFYSTNYANRVGVVRQVTGYRGHNLYLELAAETGLVGLIAFVLVAGSVLLPVWRFARSLPQTHPELADLAKASFFALAGYLISAVFLHLEYQRYFWLLMALATVACTLIRDELRHDAWLQRADPEPAMPVMYMR